MGYNANEKPKTGSLSAMNLIIEDDVYQKIMYWINKAPGEISGLGKVMIDEAGTMRVTSAILLTQENTGTSTDIDAAAVAKAMFELRDEPGQLNFWWHSHVYMGVFWSGTDIDTIREIGGGGWVVATVFNKKCEMRSAFYSRANEGIPEVFIDLMPTKIQKYISKEATDAWDAEYEKKCKVKSYSNWSGSYGGYYGNDYGGGYGKKDETTALTVVGRQDDLPFDQAGGARVVIDTVAEAEECFTKEHTDKINGWFDSMCAENDIESGKKWLYKICHEINTYDKKSNDFMFTKKVKKELRDYYINEFNIWQSLMIERAEQTATENRRGELVQ